MGALILFLSCSAERAAAQKPVPEAVPDTDYSDHVQSGASSFGFTDVELSTSLGPLGQLKAGKMKEPFVRLQWIY